LFVLATARSSKPESIHCKGDHRPPLGLLSQPDQDTGSHHYPSRRVPSLEMLAGGPTHANPLLSRRPRHTSSEVLRCIRLVHALVRPLGLRVGAVSINSVQLTADAAVPPSPDVLARRMSISARLGPPNLCSCRSRSPWPSPCWLCHFCTEAARWATERGAAPGFPHRSRY